MQCFVVLFSHVIKMLSHGDYMTCLQGLKLSIFYCEEGFYNSVAK